MSAQQLITEHIDLWTSTIKARKTQGRGSNKKRELYGIKKLRELILELAVRGKLVEQDHNDEPASILIARIATEKRLLVKENKIKKQKPLSETTEEEKPFEVPEGWHWEKLGNLFYLEMGQSPASKYYNQDGEGLPFFQGKADFGKKYPTPRYWCVQPQKHAYPGDVLLSVRAPVGPTNIANIKCCIGRGLAALRPLSGISTSFVFYTMHAFRNTLELLATGTTFSAVSKVHVENLAISVPPLKEQHRIVAKVDELMALCDQLEQQTESSLDAHNLLVDTLLSTLTDARDAKELSDSWARFMSTDGLTTGNAGTIPNTHSVFDTLITTDYAVEQLKQTILQLAVMGKLVPQNPNDEPASKLLKRIAAEKAQLIKDKKIKKQKELPPIGDDENLKALPAGWSYAYMQNITKVVTCGMASTPKYQTKGRMFLSAKNIKPYKFMPEEHKFVDDETFRKITQNACPERGDILLTRVGAGIGEAAVIDRDIEFAFYVSLTLVKPFLTHINSNYLLHWLNSPQGVKKSLDNVYGAGVSQGNLNVNQVRRFEVPIPPLEEQQRIVTKVDKLITLCDQLKSQLNHAQTTQLHLSDAVVENALTA